MAVTWAPTKCSSHIARCSYVKGDLVSFFELADVREQLDKVSFVIFGGQCWLCSLSSYKLLLFSKKKSF